MIIISTDTLPYKVILINPLRYFRGQIPSLLLFQVNVAVISTNDLHRRKALLKNIFQLADLAPVFPYCIQKNCEVSPDLLTIRPTPASLPVCDAAFCIFAFSSRKYRREISNILEYIFKPGYVDEDH